MRDNMSNAAGIQTAIAKGWRPNRYLSNMSLAAFADTSEFVATRIFPICPVSLSTGYYYTFDRGDLVRDYMERKPKFGKVAPVEIGHSDNTYKCFVDQIITGIDQIGTVNSERAGVPASVDPRRSKARFIATQTQLHLEVLFAKHFFQTGVWDNEFTGIASGGASPNSEQFIKFDDANSDPIKFFDTRKREIKLRGGRVPNKLTLGYDTFNALKEHPDLLERVKYTGSTANPAQVNERVLAELFGFEQVSVLQAAYNKAEEGQETEMEFICDPKGALLSYAPPAPRIDEPSAGYIFAWDPFGNGSWIFTDQFEGEGGTHSEYIEGLTATDMKKTCDDLACYCASCCD